MTAFTSLLEGLQQVFTLEAMCYLLAGVFIGNVAGLLPGLGATSGLPVSAQLQGPAFADATLLTFARAIERSFSPSDGARVCREGR